MTDPLLPLCVASIDVHLPFQSSKNSAFPSNLTVPFTTDEKELDTLMLIFVECF